MLKTFLISSKTAWVGNMKIRMYSFPQVKIISGHVCKTVVNFKNNQGFCLTEHTFLQCLLSKTHISTLFTYQTGVFSWRPHTSLQGIVKQTKAWASQQPFWSIQPSSFLLCKMWWLFAVNYIILRKAEQVLTFYGYILLQKHLKTGHHLGYTNLFFSLLCIIIWTAWSK